MLTVTYSKIAKYVEVNGKTYLNLASYNMLNLVGNPLLEVRETYKYYSLNHSLIFLYRKPQKRRSENTVWVPAVRVDSMGPLVSLRGDF